MTAAVLALIVEVAAQSASTITGRVVADDTGKAVANARVSVTTSSGFAAPVTLTDADGRFSLPRSAEASRSSDASRFVVAVTKTGYTRAETAADDRAIDIRLKRGAVISGRVVDEFGEPVPLVRVAAQADHSARIAFANGVDTDDRGEYRLTGLPAGSFVVAVTRASFTFDPATGRNREPTTVFYPGAASADGARAVPVAPGEEQRRIDFVFPALRPEAPTLMVIRAAQSAGQPTRSGPAPTGVIRGRVVDTGGRPVPHALVQLLSPSDIMQWQGMLADDRGGFEFGGVAAGTFRVAGTKTGYSLEERLVTIREAGISDETEIRIARYAVVTGRIVDELGEPIERVSVDVMDAPYEAGRRRLMSAGRAALTDDDGRFRLFFGQRRGQFVISAVAHGVTSAELPGYARTFYPGTTNPADARFVAIGAAEEIGGIDFALSRARTFLIAGRLLDAGGSPTTGGGLQLIPAQGAAGIVGAPIGARVNSNGAFEFPNVTPGQYVIRADRGRRNGWTE
ncbi:MAG TPA: carboxypeptidase-like regulatory domain-containing protein, partial [Vicinamibacterales bacterium]|nr:carboxypeptidase-like regulatory domain-containing protein [Vicinamibacterales bacterium]